MNRKEARKKSDRTGQSDDLRGKKQVQLRYDAPAIKRLGHPRLQLVE